MKMVAAPSLTAPLEPPIPPPSPQQLPPAAALPVKSTLRPPHSKSAMAESTTSRATAALTSARTLLASLQQNTALTPSAVLKLQWHALHLLVQCACHCQQGVSSTSSVHSSFPSLLTRHIDLLTQAINVALPLIALLTSPPLLPSLLSHLTPLISSLHIVLAYLPSTHSICPSSRASLYSLHLSALTQTSQITSAINAALLYLKHLPSAQRGELRGYLQGTVSEKEGMEAAHARMLMTAAYKATDTFDQFRLLMRACDAASSPPVKAELCIEAAQWMHRNPLTRNDAIDLLLHALDGLQPVVDAPFSPLPAELGDTKRSNHSQSSSHQATRRPSLRSSHASRRSPNPHSHRPSVTDRSTARRRSAANVIEEGRVQPIVGVEERPLGMRELTLLVRGYTALSEMAEREDERLEWSLVAAHHVHRMWTTNTHTITRYIDQRQRDYERQVEERSKKKITHAGQEGQGEVAELTPPALPSPPELLKGVEWFDVKFSDDVQRLMDSPELSVGCLSLRSIPHPLLLFQSLETCTSTLLRHSLHSLTLPSLALQLYLTSVICPHLPLLALTHLRFARIADALGCATAWQLHMEDGDRTWRPIKGDVEQWESVARERERDERLSRTAREVAKVEESKEEMTEASAVTGASSLLSVGGGGVPSPSLPWVYLQIADLLLSFGRHTPTRVLSSIAHALALPLRDIPSLRLHAVMGSTPSTLSIAEITATAESADEFRRAFGLLMKSVEGEEGKRQVGLVEEVKGWVGGSSGVKGQQWLAIAQAMQAQCIIDRCLTADLLPPLPLTSAILHSLRLSNTSSTPLSLTSSHFTPLAFRQNHLLHACDLLSTAFTTFQSLGDVPSQIRTLCLHATTRSLYSQTWGGRGHQRGADDGTHVEGAALRWPHLIRTLQLWGQAEKLLTDALTALPPTAGASLPLQRRLAGVQRSISGVYVELYRACQPETAFQPSERDGKGEKGVGEAELWAKWMVRYDDVFSCAPPPPPPSLPQLALSKATAALALHGGGDGEYAMGRAELAVLGEEEERKRRLDAQTSKQERRALEKAAWKEVVYAPYEAPHEKAAREREEQEKAREVEEARLMHAEEEAKAAEVAMKAEEERKRKEEEEASAAKAAGKGKKGPAPSPKAKVSKEEAERLERERLAAEEVALEAEMVERERLEREAAAAEDEAFAYDKSEWSPIYLLEWKREVERERMEARMEQMEEVRGGGKAGAGAKEKDDAAKKRRQQSMASVALSDDDDGLDPTILIDEAFPPDTLPHSAYGHLTSALQSALASHDFPLLAEVSLSLVRLFTTRHPLLSSKYLALHQSAVVSAYTLQLTSTINPPTTETLFRRERDRLTQSHLGCRWDPCDDVIEQHGGGLCRESAITRLDDWMNDESLIAQWTTQSLEPEEDKDAVLKGWDAVYAQMLVSIPSSVSILTVLYSVEEHSLYLSLLSSERFPLSSRFSRTVMTEEEDVELHRLIAYFAGISDSLQAALVNASPTSPSTSQVLEGVEAEFTASLTSLNALLTLPFTRALLTPTLLNDRDLIILPCPRLFPLPWEALPLLTQVGHRSLCRDFSFAFFNRRMETSVGEPVNRGGVAWVVEGGEGGEEVEGAVTALKGKEMRGRGGGFTPGDWQGVMETARDSGAVMYCGGAPLLHSMTAATLNALDCTGVRLAVLMDHAILPGKRAEGNEGRRGALYDELLLLSVRGVNTVLTHSWSISSLLNGAHTALVARELANGQSIAGVLRLLRNQTEVEVSVGGLEVGSSGGLLSPTGRKAKDGLMSPKKSLMSPKVKGGIASPKGGKSAAIPPVAKEEAEKVVVTVRAFDRYNPVLIGLPHWRL